MKLISLEIYGKNFRSLTANKRYEFNVSERKSRLSTKCFAGLNASGKSNMLEVIGEIFYFLDYRHLKHGDENKRKGNGFGFEIEYLIPVRFNQIFVLYDEKVDPGEWLHVRIKKPLNIDEDPIEYSVKTIRDPERPFNTVDENIAAGILPSKIVAYTSGQNELLSNPFYKIKYHYWNELLKGNAAEVSDRMFFIDKANNYSIFIANMLLGEERKLAVLDKKFKLEKLHSFRITINLHDLLGKQITFSKKVQDILKKFKACATCWDERFYFGSQKRQQLVLDYYVTDATRQAFNFHFDGSPLKLFQAFYQLDTLNIGLQKNKVHKLVQNARKDLNLSDELPQIDADDLTFRIEHILLRKEYQDKDDEPLRYKHLSDGEHQLNEVLGSMMLLEEEGCLLLLDEPDTHFNPEWRSNIIKDFNAMAANSWDKDGKILSVRNQEVIITTHSPFAISDSYKEDVYCFRKDDETKEIHISNPKIPTYGTSVQTILEHVFGNKKTIANLSNLELKTIREKGIEAETVEAISIQRAKLNNFGESIEKFDTIRTLRARENEIRSK